VPQDSAAVMTTFAISTVVHWLNITVLWNMSGGVRSKTKTTLNPEDALQFKTNLVEAEPAEVARVLRAHRNTADNTLPFLFVALVFVMAGPSALEGYIFLYGFMAARVLYSVCYLKGLQPWRSIFYGVSVLLAAGTAIDALRLVLSR
jgi:uncharacterized MAPEG superfamily protein